MHILGFWNCGHGMPFFSFSLKIFALFGITQVNLVSALAYRKKFLQLTRFARCGHGMPCPYKVGVFFVFECCVFRLFFVILWLVFYNGLLCLNICI